MARGAVHAEGDGVRGLGTDAFAADRRGSSEYFESRDNHRGEAQTKAFVRARRENPHRGWRVREFQRRGGRSEYGSQHTEGFGDDFRAIHARGVGFRASGEGRIVMASFERGDRVQVNDGVFAHFTGMVTSVNSERRTLLISVNVFSRSTEIELNFTEVRKVR